MGYSYNVIGILLDVKLSSLRSVYHLRNTVEKGLGSDVERITIDHRLLSVVNHLGDGLMEF